MELSRDELLSCLEAQRPRLVRLATSLLSDAEQAEDAVQDASMKAVQAAGSFRSESAVCTWVQRIVVNTCRDLLRRRQSRESVEAAARREALWQDSAYSVDPEGVAVAAESQRTLGLALARLTADQKQAVVLHDVEGWSGTEIADATGWPLGTVKSHLRRGRQNLVSMLAEEFR
ncbi:MAG: sigma-70 family RNA polymerase sigma factor [Candidatus Dormibacteraeota bacterium]|nr:sigma-70 family RNA polymerase sigma factor [Candidatus Dormibacteraeota bacterium]